ncbi:hypothetical protein GH714_011845 [Hevea brasiliensis]|uniref:Retrovirus-related Pol polyprotein from transposon TNT 1-94-like beta-barrel domain-containing protein n=1 Tax=Hevea brasiliensis TaxID=3981 RepID=A0A6A6L287_HEVBR|nr:hypothetical protein GH714_011845 [Hevea brasiliensis]
MNDLLFVMKLHLPVFVTNKPEDKRDKDWAFEHEYVHGFIQQFVEDNETLKVSIINSAPNGVVNMKYVKSSIMNEETRWRSQNSASSSQSDILVIDFRGRSESRSFNLRDRSRGKSNKYANVECHYCKKKGHIQKFCRKFKKDQGKNKGKEVRKEDSSDDECFNVVDEFNMVYNDDIINLTTHKTSWVIDSGATIYVTSRKELFSFYTHGDFGSIKMGNDNLSKVVGKGDACLMIENGMRLVLRDVRHIPNMRLNLIFVDRFDNGGFCNTFKNGKWKLTKGSLVKARGIKLSRLYMMQAKLSSDVVGAVEKDSIIELWPR